MPRTLAAALLAAVIFPISHLHAESLTLESAIRRTVAAAPENAVAAAQMDALRAARGLAGARPPSGIEVAAEDFAGTGPYMLDRSEVTATYAPVIERGSKRQTRLALADRDIEVAEAEALARRLDASALAHRGYVEVQAAEAALVLARQRLLIARGVAREVGRRVAAVRDPLFAGTRANTLVNEALVDIELAEHARDAALARLVALWGGAHDGLTVPADAFLRPGPDAAAAPAPATADLALAEARARRAQAAIEAERARGKPDITMRGGVRYLAQTNDVALVAGFSLPLARPDTNRLAVERAQAEARRAEADRGVVHTLRLRELRLAEEKVGESLHEAEAIRDKVIPGLERTLAQVTEGYRRGGFTFNDVHQAQAALADARARLLRAATEHHMALVDRDRLTGRFASLVSAEIAQ
jgi:outer membrane protein, heavy metal efflux system